MDLTHSICMDRLFPPKSVKQRATFVNSIEFIAKTNYSIRCRGRAFLSEVMGRRSADTRLF